MADRPYSKPAFPQPQYREGWPSEHGNDGMDLRDYFAGQALAGFVAGRMADGSRSFDCADAANRSYALADAMMRARDGK